MFDGSLKHNKSARSNHKVSGEWINIPGQPLQSACATWRLGLASFGHQSRRRVALLSKTGPKWSITDLAILSLGAVNVPSTRRRPSIRLNSFSAIQARATLCFRTQSL